MAQRNNYSFAFLLVIVGILAFFLFRPFAYAIAIAAGIIAAISLLYITSRWLFKSFRKFRLRNTLEGILEEKLDAIAKKIRKLIRELDIIESEILDLEQQLAEYTDLSDTAASKVEHLINEFGSERMLKETKLEALRSVELKFQSLLNDQKVLRTMARKKAKLKEVSSRKAGEILELQNLKSEKEFIEDLDFLRLKIEETENIDTALSLNRELVQLER
ncbi:MAG: hypothetical protein KJP00_05600 [Bacteroidia bacterium]|nr:hypothetical protein [Bacteroidia bacterium]